MITAGADQVILVDPDDVAVGYDDKLTAHREGKLHRAFSVFVVNSGGELLLQRRAESKYHSGGLWSNTCCSHPRPGERTRHAAQRRLVEEMGFACDVTPLYRFIYRAELDGGMIEHECDYVYLGRFNGRPDPDPREVAAWRWASPETITRELEDAPERFTFWFDLAFRELCRRGALR
jgi:isopentenyl-diphosphate Delta-isomerase